MWSEFVHLSQDEKTVTAKLPTSSMMSNEFDSTGLERALAELGVKSFFIDDTAVQSFIFFAKEGKKEAFQGVDIAFRKNASVDVVLEDHDMIAKMVVKGAYGGRGLSGGEIVEALAKGKVKKGINKLALKKVLAMSQRVSAGEEFIQAVAVGKNAVDGKDTQFKPLVPDINSRILKPQEINNVTHKVDMRNLGETITVEEGEAIMRRIPATKGTPGYTVTGKVIPPNPGTEKLFKEAKGSKISKQDPTLLVAAVSGMPIIKDNTVEVDNALVLKKVDVSTGHIKFKGSVVINGDVEPGMKVLATGSVTVGGFIESADVQAHGDINVAKGIIGRPVQDDEEVACVVRSGGTITTKYAQYAKVQAHDDINMAIHCLQSEVRCGGDLVVDDGVGKQGTLSGGTIQVGGKITCINLGAEGGTATEVEACARYNKYRQGIENLKQSYTVAQEDTMTVVRAEMELAKTPKKERTQEMIDEIMELKKQTNTKLSKAKKKLEMVEQEFEQMLEASVIIVKNKLHPKVTISYGDESTSTKRMHGPSQITFNHYEIEVNAYMG
ncbi:FapA family protein [Vibrio sp. SCSIO 43136]|uniref:DUF342 domain-containing protein n=1 Tax=Vibrio sp. SCSIO 43136 TaxID=2819101 RepID=UPI002075E813|nr:FapA family protein [Vibrio sp. SCSIO 43136]USD67476.1 DUF342 domain-containing protein [Vibrio sp. SCSIO 43136]